MNDIATMTRPQVFAELRNRNITQVRVHFSGGNDEGGADGFTAVMADGTQTELVGSQAYQDWQTKQWLIGYGADVRPATDDEIAGKRLSDALEQPVYDQYGGFGGDFSVSGTVTWDVATGKAVMTKSESSYTDYEDEV